PAPACAGNRRRRAADDRPAHHVPGHAAPSRTASAVSRRPVIPGPTPRLKPLITMKGHNTMRLHITSTGHPRTRRWLWLRRSVVTVAAAGALAGVLAPLTASAAAPGPGGPPVPALAWHRCARGFECATAPVPLDYPRPHAATLT